VNWAQAVITYGFPIAAAELAWGAIKYYTAPTTGLRREAIDEFYGVLLGAIITAVMGYYVSNATILSERIAGAFGIGGTAWSEVSASGLYGTLFYDFVSTITTYVGINVAIFLINFLPLSSFEAIADIARSVLTPYLNALMLTMTNTAGLAGIALVLGKMNQFGIPPLSVALLLPRRTRSIGAWLVSFFLVFNIAMPIIVAYQTSLVMQYVLGLPWNVTCSGWAKTVTDAFITVSNWIWGAIGSALHITSTTSAIANATADAYNLLCVITTAFAERQFLSTFAPLIGPFYLISGDFVIDIMLGISFAVVAWLSSIIESGATALFEVKKV
jgi:hypothetical protein